MSIQRTFAAFGLLGGMLVLAFSPFAVGQPDAKKDFLKEGPFGKGPGGMGGQTRKILKDYDKDANGRLDATERAAAREGLKKQGGGRPMGKMPFGRGNLEPANPGPQVKIEDVKPAPKAPLYDPNVLRTIFLEFEEKDWEAELQEFHGTDVEVAATMIVDGKKYPNVGIHFRGMSSYGMVPAGHKRSFNVSMDFADSKQRLYGYKTLNLLNSHDDASMMNSVLYSHIARKHIPAPKANFVKVVINGESWGIYANVQQFDKVFLKENFKTDKGTRWKVRGNPGAASGLEYLGENVEEYKRKYEIKSDENEKAWKALINFCKVLNQTPPDKLEEALKPICDLDGLLWFIALDIALINGDGYWIRSSDYSIYLDDKNKIHLVPHDMNEAFRPGGGPGGGMMRMGPPPGEVLPRPLQDMLQMTAEQKKQLEELQKEVDATLEKVLSKEQRDQLKAMRTGGPGGFGPPPGGPGGPPGGLPPGGPPPGGPAGFGPPGGGGGVSVDPLVGLTDTRKPVRSRLLAVPSLRKTYLEHVRQIANESLDWKNLGPVVAQHRTLIEKEVELDTRKLESFEAFKRATADTTEAGSRGREMSLRAFADQRRKYLLEYKEPASAR
jgi:hypothetical protein